MKPLLGLLLLATAGCSGFASPTAEQLQLLPLVPRPAAPVVERLRIQISVDSPWLVGEFEGVVLARSGSEPPVIRLQLFGDVGPKMLDLLASPDRMIGYFPQIREGIDCTLPREAAPHPLLFLGASLVEMFTPISADRVLGIREEEQGWWIKLEPAIRGMRSLVFRNPAGAWSRRRYFWMYGVGWDEDWSHPDRWSITAPHIALRVRILERERGASAKPTDFELKVPSDVAIVVGSRK
ncbi:MAG TPA: hypothetical protein VKW04_23310 [Planctomycetota bacterium]|nr:hypothetical protein [Planctomycetota bacterium]